MPTYRHQPPDKLNPVAASTREAQGTSDPGQVSKRLIPLIYDRLLRAYGPQNWWPAQTPTEVVIGAILTQNTAWTNVEKAIGNLRRVRSLSWEAIHRLSFEELAELIRPCGTYRVKARRLKAFAATLFRDHRGSLKTMLSGELSSVRKRLLDVSGIGPETADAILLYAADRPTFVVDAYTTRMMRRHRLIDGNADYTHAQELFMGALPPDAAKFNEYHALLVELGKRHCRSRAQCNGCPLADLPHDESL